MSDFARNTKIAEDKEMASVISAAQVHSIFNTQGSLLSGIIFAVVAAGITAEKTGLPVLWLATATLAAAGTARLYTMVRYRHRSMPGNEAELARLKYEHNVAAMVQISALSFWVFAAIAFTDDPIIHLIAITVLMALASGGAARAYGQKQVFRYQILVGFCPVIVALFLKLTTYYVFLSLAGVAYMATLIHLAANMNAIFMVSLLEKERANKLAKRDVLTTLPNRLGFQNELEPALKNNNRLSAFLLVDLDHFKEINDTLGHPIGDRLLSLAANRLKQSIREHDIVARLGGDEFAAFIRGVESPNDIDVIAARIVETISRKYDIDNTQIEIGASVGIALTTLSSDYDTLLKNADLALYAAKARGRGVHCFFDPTMAVEATVRRSLEIDFKTALANSEFELHFQPIVNIKSREIKLCEALLRWNHPIRGFVPPTEIINIAQSLKLLPDLGRWVGNRACAECVKWPENISIAINVSPAGLKEHNFVDKIRGILDASGLSAQRLNLEITERVLLDNDATTKKILSNLHDLGVGVSLDDFGTGYSSLSYLHHFRHGLQKIKIDRSFLDGNDREYARTVLCSIAQLATDLGLSVVVEGIETPEQLKLISACPIEEAQGFLFKRPLPAADIRVLLEKNEPLTIDDASHSSALNGPS